MGRFIRSLLGLIVIIVVASALVLFLGWSRVPDLLAGSLSKKLKVLVEIGNISVSLKNIEVDKLEIGNPRGFYLPRAFACDQIFIEAPLTRYLKNDVEIDEIDLDNVYLGLEFDSPSGTEGNWTTIMHNAASAQAEGVSSTKKTVMIRRLILNNIRTDLVYRNQGNRVRHLPVINRIELKNISSEGGDITDQIMNSTLGQMLKEIFIEQNLKELLDKVLQPGGQNPVEDALRQFRGFLNADMGLTPPPPSC